MSALDLLDRNIKIEHLEGYLYGIQEIENFIVASQGSTREYSISSLQMVDGQSDSQMVESAILDKIQYSEKITYAIQNNFNSKIQSIEIPDWKSELTNSLKGWFIDKHLSERSIKIGSVKYMNKFDDWTEDQIKKFTLAYEERERKTKERLLNQNKSIRVFIDMIEVFMDFNFSFFKYDLSEVKLQRNHYPSAMSIFWGMNFDLYFLKNEEKNILLHFGQLLD